MDYFKSFVLGSSYLTFVLFSLGVQSIDKKKRKYSYEKYSLIEPIYFGIINIIILYLIKNTDYKETNIYIIIGLLSFLFVFGIAKSLNVYDYTNGEWTHYFVTLLVLHLITICIIIRYLNFIFKN
jgi:uncharacterized membrane protein